MKGQELAAEVELSDSSTAGSSSGSSVAVVGLSVCQPELLALFLASVFHLIEFSEASYLRPLEPVLVALSESGDLRIHYRAAVVDLPNLPVIRSASVCEKQCCSLS